MHDGSKHTAAGPMAGYLFQPERALDHLARSRRGAIVGVETLDDVAVVSEDGRTIREQDKHYTSDKAPLADRSKELWNSLKIWLDAIESEDLDMAATEFHLVTNKNLSSGLAWQLMHQDGTTASARGFVTRLRSAGKKPPKELRELFKDVMRRSDEQLVALVMRIRVFDASHGVHGASLRSALQDYLHLPPAHAAEIIQGLLGWIDELVLQEIREKKPAWITRSAFDERYLRLLHRYQDIDFIRETEEALIPVEDDEREERKKRLFVKQLRWIGCSEEDEDNQILEAIDAHIRAGSEVARLSQMGVVPLQEFRAFDERLFKRWNLLRRLHFPVPIPESEREKQALGRELLNQTLNHREILAGQQTSEFYLTQGAYHRLADEVPRLGWHPKFKEMVKSLNDEKREAHAISDRG